MMALHPTRVISMQAYKGIELVQAKGQGRRRGVELFTKI